MNGHQEEDLLHPLGEDTESVDSCPAPQKIETFGGMIEVQWEEDAGVNMHGGMAFFIEFLKLSGIWEKFVEECPLKYTSPNAPTQSEILGTILFSVLSGRRRYARITGIRGDDGLPQLFGIERFRSEDSVRQAFETRDEEALILWMDRQIHETYAALLDQEWILDLDATVKTLDGRQEEACVGYKPRKPGRPSHVSHTMVLTAAKLVLNVDAEAGHRIVSAYGNEEMMKGCEARKLPMCLSCGRPGVLPN